MRKFTLDSNLFIQGFRDPSALPALIDFHRAFAPFEYLSSVVAMELRAGVPPEHAKRLERELFAPFERRGRILTPSHEGWKRAGEALARLHEREGLELRRISRSFVNDVLLAVTCREWGVTLVTDNVSDFARIQTVTPFEFVRPWPQQSY